MPDKLSEIGRENLSKKFSLRLVKSLEDKHVDFEKASGMIQDFLSRLENTTDAREIENCIEKLS